MLRVRLHSRRGKVPFTYQQLPAEHHHTRVTVEWHICRANADDRWQSPIEYSRLKLVFRHRKTALSISHNGTCRVRPCRFNHFTVRSLLRPNPPLEQRETVHRRRLQGRPETIFFLHVKAVIYIAFMQRRHWRVLLQQSPSSCDVMLWFDQCRDAEVVQSCIL